MANTYHNVILKGPAQDQIVAHLDGQKQAAFVSPTLDGLTFVYAPDEVWSAPAEDLSHAFHCLALFSSVYDSDVFEYILYDDGRRIDAYISAPDYGDGENWEDNRDAVEEPTPQPTPASGDARLLCASFGVESAVEQVEAILHPSDESTVRDSAMGAFYQHWALAETMGWPPDACITDYGHLESQGVDDDLAGVFTGAPFVKTPTSGG